MCMYQNFNQLLVLETNQIIIKLDTLNTKTTADISGNSNSEITNFLGGCCFEAAMGYTPGNEQMIREENIYI
jgi:hypothetical protein